MRCHKFLLVALTLFSVLGLSACGGGGTAGVAPAAFVPWPTTAPSIVSLTPGTRELSLSWTAIPDATAYGVYLATQAGITQTNYWSLPENRTVTVRGATSTTIDGLVDGATYWCIVAARSDLGEGPASGSANGTLSPGEATRLQYSATLTGGYLSWIGARGATTYDVYVANVAAVSSDNWSTQPGGQRIQNVSPPVNVTGLDPYAPSYAIVVAKNATGRGPDSLPAALTPSAPTGLTFTAGNAEAVLTWNPAAAALSYDVYLADDPLLTSATYASLPGGRRIVGATSPLLVTGLTNGKTTYALVVAVGDGNSSPDSSLVAATPSGRGTFLDGGTVATGSNPEGTLLVDMNQDSVLDLILANYGDNTVWLMYGHGDGTFGDPTSYSVGAGPVAVVTADLNGDGWLDFASADYDDSTTTVYLADGSGGFTLTTSYYVGYGPVGILALQTNNPYYGYGAPDLVVINAGDSTLSVMNSYGGGWYDQWSYPYGPYYYPFKTGTAPQHPVSGDFNGDGVYDVLMADSGDGTVSFFAGDNGGGFYPPVTSSAGTTPYAFTVLDLDNDGYPDLLVADAGSDTLLPLYGAGDGSFSAGTGATAGPSPEEVFVGDFDGDGNLDAAVLCAGAPCVRILLGDGAGGVASTTDYPLSGTPSGMEGGDFNADGVLDLAVTDESNGYVVILIGSPV